MRYLFTALIVLVGGVALGELLVEDAGFVVIGYGGRALRTSLVLFVIMLAVALAGCFLIARLAVSLWTARARLRRWSRTRRALRAERALHRGVVALAGGDWQEAEHAFAGGAHVSATPWLHYLGAARAAQAQSASERRDDYLRLARASAGADDAAVALAGSEMQLARGDAGAAGATLSRLLQVDPRNRQALKLQAEVHLRQGAWEALRALLPELRRRRVLERDAADSLERQAYLGLLEEARRQAGADPDAAWRQVPDRQRVDPAIFAAHCRNLARAGREADAAALLAKRLRKDWAPTLVELYGELAAADPLAQLAQAERWLAERGADPQLLCALGRLASRNKLWGKARSYFQEALHLEAKPATFRLLAQTLERMGDAAAAAECARQGLAAATVPESGSALVIRRE
jgi:HemY protein